MPSTNLIVNSFFRNANNVLQKQEMSLTEVYFLGQYKSKYSAKGYTKMAII